MDMDMPTERSSEEGGTPDVACTWACSCWTRRQVELEVFTEEASWVVGVEATVRIAMERRTCAGGGLSREETVKLSKLTRGQEAREVRECWSDISQEKEMF